MDEKKLRELMETCSESVRESLGEEFAKLGYILLVRTREVGNGYYAIASDVGDTKLISATLHMGALLVEREPERMMRPRGKVH